MHGEKRREIPLIDRHGADQRGRPGSPRDRGDRQQVRPEIGANAFEPGIIRRDLLPEKHFHSSPFTRGFSVTEATE